jgi:hypothetical protein
MSQHTQIRPTDPLIPWSRVPKAINPHYPPHLATVCRWAFVGVGDPRVRLATIKIGGRRYTTASAIAAFIAATSHAATLPSRPAAEPAVTVIQAERELDAAGV